MDTLLKGTLWVAVMILLAGIIGAAITGSDRAFDLSPWLRSRTASAPASPAPSVQAVGQSPCIPDPQSVPLTREQAQSLWQQVTQGAQFQQLSQAEQVLGRPACRLGNTAETVLMYQVTEGEAPLLIAKSARGVTVQWLPRF